MPMRVRVGTSGYAYPKWRGSFYPEGLKPEEMLPYYATRFGTVEINNTFYRMPKREVVAHWAEEVQARADFVFVLKASQRITHSKRLVGAESEMSFLLGNATALGPALGPLLFQLPPFLRKDAARLREFLKLVPPQRAAFEFRHASWHDDEVRDVLREGGAALVLADGEGDDAGTDTTLVLADGEGDDAGTDTTLVATADWGYLRLRRGDYDDDALRSWAGRILAQPWREAFVFFKHEDDGPQGPDAAGRFLDVLKTLGA